MYWWGGFVGRRSLTHSGPHDYGYGMVWYGMVFVHVEMALASLLVGLDPCPEDVYGLLDVLAM